MEQASVETSFNMLPVKFQVHILQLLSRTDVKSARLVCPYWFRLLSFIRPPGFQLNDSNKERLEILNQSFHSSIGLLLISNYTETLPIYTSTRCGIPKTKCLELGAGNSVENIMKLLRNYAQNCGGLSLLPNCLEKVAPFRLKGLTYESLRCLDIKVPSNNFQDFGKRAHLSAMTQFLETTKLPNLQSLVFKSGPLYETIHTIRKFSKATNIFIKTHGHQLCQLNSQIFLPVLIVNSFQHMVNLEILSLDFHYGFPMFWHSDSTVVQESLKLIKKLKSLEFINFTDSTTHRYHSEFILSILEQNKECIKKFCFGCYCTRMDWIPVDYEIGLKEIDLRFQYFNENLFTRTTNPNQKLQSVTKLHFQIKSGRPVQNWMAQVSFWTITVFPNLKNLTLDCPSILLKLSDCRSFICNLVHLKKLLIVNGFGYFKMTDETRNWFTQNNHTEFIKAAYIDGGFEILISRPLPNNIFD